MPTPAEEIGETFTLSVLVLSDSYFGLDQQYDIDAGCQYAADHHPAEG